MLISELSAFKPKELEYVPALHDLQAFGLEAPDCRNKRLEKRVKLEDTAIRMHDK